MYRQNPKANCPHGSGENRLTKGCKLYNILPKALTASSEKSLTYRRISHERYGDRQDPDQARGVHRDRADGIRGQRQLRAHARGAAVQDLPRRPRRDRPVQGQSAHRARRRGRKTAPCDGSQHAQARRLQQHLRQRYGDGHRGKILRAAPHQRHQIRLQPLSRQHHQGHKRLSGLHRAPLH